MTANATFEKLKKYLENRPASQKAILHLKDGVEISIVIGHHIECTLFNKEGRPCLELRAAKNHDVVFYLKPEVIDVLIQNEGVDVGELGIAVLKEYLAGGLRIKVVGSAFGIMKNGYVGIIKEGGVTFGKFLAMHGVTNISKILSVIKNLKKET